MLRERGQHVALQDEIDVARARFDFGAARGDVRDDGVVVDDACRVLRGDARRDALELQPRDVGERIGRERRIRNLGHPREQRRLEMARQRRAHRRAHRVRIGSRAARGDVGDDVRAEIRREEDHRVREVDLLAFAVGQRTLVEHLVEQVQHVGVRLLDFV
ncbi:hypothetical protein X947_4275 [Burkholderia pseudomallei MSHR7334]|nr:hypothetical protein X947_4275 [Burkholderia pseudomallei MSHR7334]